MLELKEDIMIDADAHKLEIWGIEEGEITAFKFDDKPFIRLDKIKESIDIFTKLSKTDFFEKEQEPLEQHDSVIKELKPELETEKKKDFLVATEVIDHVNGVPIKKTVVTYLKKELPDSFCKKYVFDKLEELYKMKHKKASRESLETYGRAYIKYLKKNNFINVKEIRTSNVRPLVTDNIYQIKHPEQIGEKNEKQYVSELEYLEKYILDWSEKNATDLVDINLVYRNKIPTNPFKSFTRDSLFKGCKLLEEKKLAKQVDKSKFILYRDKLNQGMGTT